MYHLEIGGQVDLNLSFPTVLEAAIAADAAGATAILEISPVASYPMKLDKKVRQFLEWSWDYGIAEQLHEESIKSIARDVSSGIMNGKSQTDSDLVIDFIENRVVDFATMKIDDDWIPGEDDLTLQELLDAISLFPDLVKVVKEFNESC